MSLSFEKLKGLMVHDYVDAISYEFVLPFQEGF
jgi:hypothetical protein